MYYVRKVIIAYLYLKILNVNDINEFYKKVKSWPGGNAVHSENSDRKFHLYIIDIVQNNFNFYKRNINSAVIAMIKSETICHLQIFQYTMPENI